MANAVDGIMASFNPANLRTEFYDIAQWVIWGVVILAVCVFAWLKYQDKKIFIYPVRIFRRRTNGLVKEINKFGGYIQKGAETIFIIKMTAWKKKELGRLPDSDLMDEEDRVYFYQLSPESPLIQCKREFKVEEIFTTNEQYVEPSDIEKENRIARYIAELKLVADNKEKAEDELKLMALTRLEEELEQEKQQVTEVTKVYYSPVPSDQKLQAYYDIRKLSATLGVDANKQFAYFIMGVIAILVLGAIIFYIAVNQGDIPILTK